MESEILIKLSKGDKAAFKHVFDMYYSSICLFIKKYNFELEQAEDIAQEVFIKIWEKN
jgi:DNA-directed RNA polymerase specialized sigma24 family protein